MPPSVTDGGQTPPPSTHSRKPGQHRRALVRLRRAGSTARQVLVNLGLLALGSAIYVVGVNGILVPHGFFSGGVLGISLIVHYLFPFLGLGMVNAALNLPLYFLGWFNISRRFMLYTAFGIAVFSFLADWLKISPLPVKDPLLAAVLAGIICGLGSGIILRSAGSGGGLDILCVYLNRKLGLRPGLTSILANGVILSFAALLFSLDKILYTLIFVFTAAKVMDAVITGFNQRKSILIVSDYAQNIAEAILTQLHRGVTFLQGAGAYTGREKKVILSVVTLTELARVKELIFGLDPQAFVIINDTLEVLGKWHGQRKIW